MCKYGLFVKFTAIEGKRDMLVEILLSAAKSMDKVTDCEFYMVNIANDDSNSVYVYEVWKNEHAHKNSLSLEATQTLIQRAKPLIMGMEIVNTLSLLGGKGVFTES